MIIADYIIPLKQVNSDFSREKCIHMMLDNGCLDFPVISKSQFYAKVDLDECIHSEEDTIISLLEGRAGVLRKDMHIFDALRVFKDTRSSVCAAVDLESRWLGIVKQEDIFRSIADLLTIEQMGSILIVEMAAHQYSSSEICRIIEGEGSQVLGLLLSNVPESGRIRASVKLNTINVERIIRSLMRFKYEVIATFGDEDYKENVVKKYESFMKYIDL